MYKEMHLQIYTLHNLCSSLCKSSHSSTLRDNNNYTLKNVEK